MAGKAGASCALAILLVRVLRVPDVVTATFVAILCCSPAALMGLRTSFEQLTGSALGGVWATLAVYCALPLEIGVPLAVTCALLSTYAIGFYGGTVAAAFTALFVQIVSFGDPLQTFGYRLEAVGIAGLSAFVVNVFISAFFYEGLFARRLGKVRTRLQELLRLAGSQGIGVMHPLFAVVTQLDGELEQALSELAWRRNEATSKALRAIRGEVVWLRNYVHLLVDLELTTPGQDEEIKAFLRWLPERDGEAPPLSGESASTQKRILAHLATRPSDSLRREQNRPENPQP